MSASATADPVRTQVEDALHRMVADAVSTPCRVFRSATRVAGQTADRAVRSVVGPIGLLRSIVELSINGLLAAGSDGVTPAPSAAPAARPRSESGRSAGPSASAETRTARRVDEGDRKSGPSDLPLHGYESLAASHVVARLERLTPEELEQIREFELAHRGRRTVLGKIDQLRAPA